MGVHRSPAWIKRHWPKTTGYILILVGILLLAAGTWSTEAGASPAPSAGSPAGAREPFVSRPAGPFALLANPAIVALEDELGLHLSLQAGGGQKPMRLLAYTDPGTGLAAGAFAWLDGADENGERWRQIAYSLARFLTDRIAFGANIKHVADEEGGRWATDLGLYIPAKDNVHVGLVYYNAFGAADDDPEEIAAAVSLLSQWGWTLSVEVRGPWASDGLDPALSLALDIPLGSDGLLRAGRLQLFGDSGHQEWLTGLFWDFGPFGVDAVVVWPAGGTSGDVRYRVGVQTTF